MQLHCHLEGTVRAETFAELAERYDVPTEYRRGDPSERDRARQPVDSIYRFTGFQEFLFKFAAVCRSLQQPADYARILYEYADEALANGVMYAELFVSPSTWRFFHHDLNLEEVFEALHHAAQDIEKRYSLPIRFIVDITRNFGPEKALESVQLAIALRHYGVVAVGLGGDEANHPATVFDGAFKAARDGGLHCVAHAGEAAGPQSVRDAVQILGAERIGHGIRALEDPDVVALLKDGNVTLEACPTSNMKTGVVEKEPHPMRALYQAGVPLMIDSDDPAIFETDITREYAYAESLLGSDALLLCAHQAIQASFADALSKAQMAQKLKEETAELFPNRRS